MVRGLGLDVGMSNFPLVRLGLLLGHVVDMWEGLSS